MYYNGISKQTLWFHKIWTIAGQIQTIFADILAGQFIIIVTQRIQIPEQAFNRSILNNYSENRCQHILAKMDYEFESQLCIPMLAASHRISQKTDQNKNICRPDENMYAIW